MCHRAETLNFNRNLTAPADVREARQGKVHCATSGKEGETAKEAKQHPRKESWVSFAERTDRAIDGYGCAASNEARMISAVRHRY